MRCPSEDWDRYCDGLDEEAEAERQWWIRHADHVLQVVLARSTALATNHTKQIVEFAAAVVHEIYDRTIDPATGEEGTLDPQQEVIPQNERTPLGQSDRAALKSIDSLFRKPISITHRDNLLMTIQRICLRQLGAESVVRQLWESPVRNDPSSSP